MTHANNYLYAASPSAEIRLALPLIFTPLTGFLAVFLDRLRSDTSTIVWSTAWLTRSVSTPLPIAFRTAFSIFLTAFSFAFSLAIRDLLGCIGIVYATDPFSGVASLLPNSAPRSFYQTFLHQETEKPFDSARVYAFPAASTPT